MSRIRGHGEGTIFFNEKKNLWVAQVSLPGGKRKAKYGKTQKEVRQWLQDTLKAQKDGMLVTEDKITVSQFLDRYMDSVAKHTLRPKTIEAYEYLIRMHIKPELGSIRISSLRPDQVQQLYADKLDTGLSNRTVQFIHSVLHKALDQALRWGLVNRNVCDLVDPPSVKKNDPAILTVPQAKQFLAHVKSSRFYPMYALAFIGLREGEILGLHIEDFDRRRHTISIRHALQYLVGKGLVITEPKTKKAKRTIKLPDFVYQALCGHCDALEENQGLMFTTSTGTPFSPRNFIRDFKEQLDECKLPEIRFHDLRHTAISYLINELKVPPSIVQNIVGHSTALLTLDTYTHTSSELQDAAMERMGDLFNEAS